jgi:hypothetical protein
MSVCTITRLLCSIGVTLVLVWCWCGVGVYVLSLAMFQLDGIASRCDSCQQQRHYCWAQICGVTRRDLPAASTSHAYRAEVT